MGAYIGIDLGTTFCAISTLDESGRPTIVKIPDKNVSPDGNIISSCVLFKGGKATIGDRARRSLEIDKNRCFGRFKRDMGTSITYDFEGKKITPFDLSTIVLSELKKIAETELGEIEKAVITIPANFGNEAREQTLMAAKKAGLNVDYIIDEPTAAALYFAFDNETELHGNYVVYDLGGGTFDVSIIHVAGQDVNVLASNGIAKLGGDDFDRVLISILKEKYKQETGKEVNDDLFYTLNMAENDKKALSRSSKCIAGGDEVMEADIQLTRKDFEKGISSLLAQTEMLCEATLTEANIDIDEISDIILVGGSTRIPAVKESIKRVFKKEPIISHNVDEMVSLGASLYAALKSDRKGMNSMQKQSLRQIKVADVANKCFGTIALVYNQSKQQEELTNTIMIHKNTKLPVSISKEFFSSHDGQTELSLTITESVSPETDPRFVKTIWSDKLLELPPDRPEGQKFIFTYSYDENQKMHVEFKDDDTGKKIEVNIDLDIKATADSEIDKFLVD